LGKIPKRDFLRWISGLERSREKRSSTLLLLFVYEEVKELFLSISCRFVVSVIFFYSII